VANLNRPKWAKYNNIETKRICTIETNSTNLASYLEEHFHWPSEINDDLRRQFYTTIRKDLPDSVYEYFEEKDIGVILDELRYIYGKDIADITIAYALGLPKELIGDLVTPRMSKNLVYYRYNMGIRGIADIIITMHQDVLDEEYDRILNMKRIDPKLLNRAKKKLDDKPKIDVWDSPQRIVVNQSYGNNINYNVLDAMDPSHKLIDLDNLDLDRKVRAALRRAKINYLADLETKSIRELASLSWMGVRNLKCLYEQLLDLGIELADPDGYFTMTEGQQQYYIATRSRRYPRAYRK